MGFLQRHARTLGFLLLAAVTVLGLRELLEGDWRGALAFWGEQRGLVGVVVGLATLDVVLEGLSWSWVYGRLGVPARGLEGLGAFLASRAGLLLPAQMGRLIRPGLLARLERVPVARCVEAEATVFVLDTVSLGALLAGLGAALWHPLAAAPAALFALALALVAAARVAAWMPQRVPSLPRGFWSDWRTPAVVLVQMLGWIAHGTALWWVIRRLPGEAGWSGTLLSSSVSAVVGAGSGLPGGIGATEGALGATLLRLDVPSEHLALAVGAFRLVTFWIWIPIGWLALLWTGRRAARRERLARVAEEVELAPAGGLDG